MFFIDLFILYSLVFVLGQILFFSFGGVGSSLVGLVSAFCVFPLAQFAALFLWLGCGSWMLFSFFWGWFLAVVVA